MKFILPVVRISTGRNTTITTTSSTNNSSLYLQQHPHHRLNENHKLFTLWMSSRSYVASYSQLLSFRYRAPYQRQRQRQECRLSSTTADDPATIDSSRRRGIKESLSGSATSATSLASSTALSSASTSPSGSEAFSAGAAAALVTNKPPTRSLLETVRLGPIGKLGRLYVQAQERRPYITQLCSALTIYLCGDLIAQLLFPTENYDAVAPRLEESHHGRDLVTVSKSESGIQGQKYSPGGGYDFWRTARHLTIGVLFSIPGYEWFMLLHRNFNYSSKFLSISTKVIVQQVFFTPIFNTYFFGMHSFLAGATANETWERLKRTLPNSIWNSLKLWPAVSVFSFMYVPAGFRSVFAGVIAIAWQTYLSWLNQKAAQEVRATDRTGFREFAADNNAPSPAA